MATPIDRPSKLSPAPLPDAVDDARAPAEDDPFTRTGFPPRFVDAATEAAFLQNTYDSSRRTRVATYVFGMVLSIVDPLAASRFLAQAPELVHNFIVGAYLLQVPTFLLALWFASTRKLSVSRGSLLQLLTLVVIEGHAEYFRILAANHGVAFPSSSAIIAFCVGAVVFGLPIRQSIAVMVLFFAAIRIVEPFTMPLTGQDYLSIGIDTIFISFAVYAAIRADGTRRDVFSKLLISEQRAYVDQLTGLSNRWGFQKDADRIVRQAMRERHPLTLAVVDLDHFKQLNDSAGHAFGDFVLGQVGRCLSGLARRPLDAVCRMGGEEFVVLWYAPRDNFSGDIGDKVLAAIRALRIQRPDRPGECITASMGIASMCPARTEDLERLMKMADECLYEAKNAGRNTYRIAALPHLQIAAARKS